MADVKVVGIGSGTGVAWAVSVTGGTIKLIITVGGTLSVTVASVFTILLAGVAASVTESFITSIFTVAAPSSRIDYDNMRN